jgi:hypothetical protein
MSYVPTELSGIDGEGPVYVLASRAATAEEAIARAVESGLMAEPEAGEEYEPRRVLMRELDPIACRIRGVDEGWWDECTARAKNPVEFWRIDV